MPLNVSTEMPWRPNFKKKKEICKAFFEKKKHERKWKKVTLFYEFRQWKNRARFINRKWLIIYDSNDQINKLFMLVFCLLSLVLLVLVLIYITFLQDSVTIDIYNFINEKDRQSLIFDEHFGWHLPTIVLKESRIIFLLVSLVQSHRRSAIQF